MLAGSVYGHELDGMRITWTTKHRWDQTKAEDRVILWKPVKSVPYDLDLRSRLDID